MIYLGIDPGFDRLGYGIIRRNGGSFQYIDSGVFSSDRSKQIGERLLELEGPLNALLGEYTFQSVAVEEVFFRKNLTTGVRLIEARGMILLTLSRFQINPIEVAPTSLKKMITGNGRAEKKQIQSVIKKLLKLESIPQPDDAADGIGLALYAAITNQGGMK
jgi:crossover junction endodeoxyribonuclease RuvC